MSSSSDAKVDAHTVDVRAEDDRIGLCAKCRHSRQIKSDRGSIFYLCRRSLTDPSFPKYPRLPVLHCSGFEAQADEVKSS
jgi:hypothetical protein